MRKADIYFNGQIIKTVEFDRVDTELVKNSSVLYIGESISKSKLAAIVPNSHLIVIKDDIITFEIKGSDLIHAVDSAQNRFPI